MLAAQPPAQQQRMLMQMQQAQALVQAQAQQQQQQPQIPPSMLHAMQMQGMRPLQQAQQSGTGVPPGSGLGMAGLQSNPQVQQLLMLQMQQRMQQQMQAAAAAAQVAAQQQQQQQRPPAGFDPALFARLQAAGMGYQGMPGAGRTPGMQQPGGGGGGGGNAGGPVNPMSGLALQQMLHMQQLQQAAGMGAGSGAVGMGAGGVGAARPPGADQRTEMARLLNAMQHQQHMLQQQQQGGNMAQPGQGMRVPSDLERLLAQQRQG